MAKRANNELSDENANIKEREPLKKNKKRGKKGDKIKKVDKKKEEMDKLKTEVEMDDHIIPLEELCKRFTTHPENVRIEKYSLALISEYLCGFKFFVTFLGLDCRFC